MLILIKSFGIVVLPFSKYASLQAITAIRNMSLQHREFANRLRDAERLRLYVQSGLSTQESLDASLKEVQMIFQRLELEAKEAADKVAWAKVERDAPDKKRRWRG